MIEKEPVFKIKLHLCKTKPTITQMKNLLLALFFFAGTALMAQTGGVSKAPEKATTTQSTSFEEVQKSLDITAEQAKQVIAIQQKFCSPDAKAKAGTSEKAAADAESNDKAFYAALLEVIPADKAEKFMKDCKTSCAMAEAKPKGKSCCSSSGKAASKSSCGSKETL